MTGHKRIPANIAAHLAVFRYHAALTWAAFKNLLRARIRGSDFEHCTHEQKDCRLILSRRGAYMQGYYFCAKCRTNIAVAEERLQ